MTRHKQIYHVPTSNPDIWCIMAIVRYPQPKPLFRRIIQRAWFKKHKK